MSETPIETPVKPVEEDPATPAVDPDVAAVEAVGPTDELVPTEDLEPSPVLVAEHVSLWYHDVIAVNDLTVHIPPGITGLLGPNGAGKSSLIKMAVGLVRPASGALRLLGQDPWNNPELIRRIGYVPEAPAPWQDETGRNAARHAARLSGMDEQEARAAADRAIARVGLEHAADKTVKTYSHGMQQRLKFALALLHEPDLFILDEPLIGADPLARRDLIHLMQELAAEGKSLLLSTHVLPDVEALTDRIVVMDHGRLLAHGTVAEIRDLLEEYPRTVRIGTKDPRTLGAAIWGWPSVLSVQAERDALVVRTDRPTEFFPALQTLLIQNDLPFTSITVPDEHVEAVFRYLVG